ncbi:hypothetical protein [Streptomyces sp. NPDC058773]|uniref:hypothetical protein n=1 Tax=Streptomyces sp. NPDC058773 TaxID=3346632 RepID=UPI0036A88FF0
MPADHSRDLDTPDEVAAYLADCGDKCSVDSGEWIGDPVEGTPKRLVDERQNCSANPDPNVLSYKSEETNGESMVVGVQLSGGASNTVTASVLPKFEKSWFSSITTGTTDQIHIGPYQAGWIEEVPVTQKLKGTWTSNEFADGPRSFPDVEADITYKVIKYKTRDLTEEEKQRCANTSNVPPSANS